MRTCWPTYVPFVHGEFKCEYGWPRMHKTLVARVILVGKERIRLLMHLHGINAKSKRKYVLTTDSKHRLPVAPDLVQRFFDPPQPS